MAAAIFMTAYSTATGNARAPCRTLQGLDAGERRELLRLFDKMIKTAGSWAKPY